MPLPKPPAKKGDLLSLAQHEAQAAPRPEKRSTKSRPPEAPLQAVDISINGLPAASEAPEPSTGELLIEHLHVGFSYQMRTGEQWQKVRLAHVKQSRRRLAQLAGRTRRIAARQRWHMYQLVR